MLRQPPVDDQYEVEDQCQDGASEDSLCIRLEVAARQDVAGRGQGEQFSSGFSASWCDSRQAAHSQITTPKAGAVRDSPRAANCSEKVGSGTASQATIHPDAGRVGHLHPNNRRLQAAGRREGWSGNRAGGGKERQCSSTSDSCASSAQAAGSAAHGGLLLHAPSASGKSSGGWPAGFRCMPRGQQRSAGRTGTTQPCAVA